MKDAIIILGGAFNPVHTQHIALLCRAKEELELTDAWNVLGGYLAIAPDGYVLHKLEKRNERTIKLKHRLGLIREAMNDIPWLRDSPFQEESLRQHDGSAFALGQRIQRLFGNNHPIQVLILIGGDRMLKKGVPIWRKPLTERSTIRVGIGRITDENINLLDLWQEDLKNNLIHNSKEFLLLNVPLRSVSSSLVRVHLNRWFDAKNDPNKQHEIENELINTQDFVSSSVMNYIKNYHDDLYIDI